MGQKIILTDSFTDLTIPKVPDDPIQNSGSLLLLDFGHSLGAFSGVPGNAAALPNVAWRTANDLVAGAPGQAALAIPFGTNTAIGSASTPIKERTSKKGLHIIYSQVNDIANATNSVGLPVAIYDYMKANQAHSYYLSIWERPTRNGITGAPFGGRSMWGSTTGNYFWLMQYQNGVPTQILPNTGANWLGTAVTPAVNTLAPTLIQHGFKNYNGTDTTTIASALPYFWGKGAAFQNTHIAHSGVLYRIYIEDLTVSGRTYAQAAAKDLELWTAAFAVGGKFYGDTIPSDPASYP